MTQCPLLQLINWQGNLSGGEPGTRKLRTVSTSTSNTSASIIQYLFLYSFFYHFGDVSHSFRRKQTFLNYVKSRRRCIWLILNCDHKLNLLMVQLWLPRKFWASTRFFFEMLSDILSVKLKYSKWEIYLMHFKFR